MLMLNAILIVTFMIRDVKLWFSTPFYSAPEKHQFYVKQCGFKG